MKDLKRISLPLGLCLAAACVCVGNLQAQQLTILPTTYVLPPSAAVTNQPGFIWNVSEVLAGAPNQLSWSEGQLAGLEGNNLADPNSLGTNGTDPTQIITTGPALPPNPPTAPISFDITNVINLNKTAAGSPSGEDFPNDDQMPGIPGLGLYTNPPLNNGTDNLAAEILTYLYLPAGTNAFGVNSDDGFRVTMGGATPQDRFAANVGQFDGGRGSADTLFQVVVQQAGVYATRVLYMNGGGGANIEFFAILDGIAGTNKVLINDLTNGGFPAYRSVTTAARAYAKSIDPTANATGVLASEGVHVVLVDGSVPVDTNSISMSFDGTVVSPTIGKSGSLTSVDYNPAPWTPLSQHSVSFAYTDGTIRATNTWSFTVQYYIALDAAWRVSAVDTTKPGFNWNIFANSDGSNTGNSNERAETDLTLQKVDNSGVLLPNIADPAAVGAAIGPATPPPADALNAPIHFEIATTLKLDIAGCCTNMPGAPSTNGKDDGQAAEVITYLNLPAGIVPMKIDADDGWRLYSGTQPADVFGRSVVAEANGPAIGQYSFSFQVPQAGIYPFRLVWENGTGGSHIYWYSLTNGSPVLVNDIAHGGIAAYRALPAGTAVTPSVLGTTPVPAMHQMEIANTNLTLVLADGANPIDTNSFTLTIDGHRVTPVTQRTANYVTVSDNGAGFPGLQLPSDVHSATVTFKDSTGVYSRTQQFSFNNIQVLILPTNPIVLETFDSYPVSTSTNNSVPPGWTAWNYTAENTAGWSITDKSSDAFKNWIIIDTATLVASVEPQSLGYDTSQTINGQPVTNLPSGNLLWATSDGRSGVQAQFCTSAPFNLSSITNPVMIYNSLMRMSANANDQADGIEYSIDGGNTWLPAVIYVTIAQNTPYNVMLALDGSIDPVRTLNAPISVLDWVDATGKAGGGTFGSGLAEPITPALAPYMAPRSDTIATSSKVDGVRLPMASKQSNVRLRFYQLGNCSWWWGVDNLAFYDIAPPVSSVPAPHIDSINVNAGQVIVKWSNGGTLQYSPSLSNPVWTTTGNSSGTFTEALTSGTRFYRVSR